MYSAVNTTILPKSPNNTNNTKNIQHAVNKSSSISKTTKQATNSNKGRKTIKKLIPKAANISKSNIENFKIMFENLFITHDIQEGYSVSDEMIQPYLDNNGFTKKLQIWLDIFKNNRFLLYLDQYINFNNYIAFDNTISIDRFVKEYYYNLPIAKKIILGDDATYATILTAYSMKIYSELNKLINYQIRDDRTREIRDTAFIFTHGELNINTSFCIVPDNVIIGFITPFNKYLINNSSTNDLLIREVFNITSQETASNPNFLINPSCSLRYDNCLNQTIYYYPGQLIPNYVFETTSLSKAGFYTDKETNIIDTVFNTEFAFNYTSSISEIFGEKYDYIKNKIIYIGSCRKSDIVLSHLATEFLYRYEHIISFINMSQCFSFNDTNIITDCKSTNWLYQKYDLRQGAISGVNSNTSNLFYDSALSYIFKENYIKKDMYLGASDIKWKTVLYILPKLSSTSQLEYINQIYKYFITMMSNNSKLYSSRLVELFEFVKTHKTLKSIIYFLKNITKSKIMNDITNNSNILLAEKKKIMKIIKSIKV